MFALEVKSNLNPLCANSNGKDDDSWKRRAECLPNHHANQYDNLIIYADHKRLSQLSATIASWNEATCDRLMEIVMIIDQYKNYVLDIDRERLAHE